MTKKTIRNALKNNGIKGWSNAVISVNGWVTTRELSGKIENDFLTLRPIDLSKNTKIVINF